MVIGWEGKWVKLQVQFPLVSVGTGVTIMEVTKGRAARYVTKEEEEIEA